MPPIRVAIIILNYRGEQSLPLCLESLHKAIGPEDNILVVDNGNEEVLMKRLQSEYPEVAMIATPKNIGFARGMNFGMRYCLDEGGVDAFWLVNNDARVTPRALKTLKQALSIHGPNALYSPCILTAPDGPVWFSGGWIDFLQMKTVHNQRAIARGIGETDFLTGCALFIPKQAFDTLGFLDERYFLYYEDAEYSLRAKRLLVPRYVVSEALVYHSEASEGRAGKLYWLVRSGAEFFLRESRWPFSLWVRGYYLLRRLKNRLRLAFFRDPLAEELERAYTDVSP